MNDKFNRLMPESEGPVLCYEISKPISAEGYEENFLVHVRRILETYGELRLLNYFTAYQGWEEQAAQMDLLAHVDLGKYVTKIAFVNAPEKEIMARLIRKTLIKGQLRFFSKNQLAEAIDWVKSDD